MELMKGRNLGNLEFELVSSHCTTHGKDGNGEIIENKQTGNFNLFKKLAKFTYMNCGLMVWRFGIE